MLALYDALESEVVSRKAHVVLTAIALTASILWQCAEGPPDEGGGSSDRLRPAPVQRLRDEVHPNPR